MNKKIQTGIRLSPDTLYKITFISKKKLRSLNGQMEFLIQNCIMEYEVKMEKLALMGAKNKKIIKNKKTGNKLASRPLNA